MMKWPLVLLVSKMLLKAGPDIYGSAFCLENKKGYLWGEWNYLKVR